MTESARETTNRHAFDEIMARYADHSILTERQAIAELEVRQIRGGFDGDGFTGYDYREQIWRRARFVDGIAHSKEGTGS